MTGERDERSCVPPRLCSCRRGGHLVTKESRTVTTTDHDLPQPEIAEPGFRQYQSARSLQIQTMEQTVTRVRPFAQRKLTRKLRLYPGVHGGDLRSGDVRISRRLFVGGICGHGGRGGVHLRTEVLENNIFRSTVIHDRIRYFTYPLLTKSEEVLPDARTSRAWGAREDDEIFFLTTLHS